MIFGVLQTIIQSPSATDMSSLLIHESLQSHIETQNLRTSLLGLLAKIKCETQNLRTDARHYCKMIHYSRIVY